MSCWMIIIASSAIISLFLNLPSSKVCGGLAGAAARAEGLGSSNQLQGSKSETFAMLGAVSGIFA